MDNEYNLRCFMDDTAPPFNSEEECPRQLTEEDYEFARKLIEEFHLELKSDEEKETE